MATLFSKLQYKGASRVLLLNAPDEFRPHLAELDDVERDAAEFDATNDAIVQIDEQADETTSYEFALVFVKSSAEIVAVAEIATAHIGDDGILWFAYPKKASKKYKTDISRDNGWQPLGDLGFEPVRQVAIDVDWSALRFRSVDKIKKMTRSFAMSEEGKQRTQKSK